ncbi:MAG: DNA phosphorothioation-associated putative methyltransferase [Candidatus Obscuribacterales bacterium]
MSESDRLSTTIDRHKSAIVRSDLSRPVRLALEAQVFRPGSTFFDYGCGHGSDIDRVRDLGFEASGWDPFFRPSSEKRAASIVNLGFVLNVIEDPAERVAALRDAWSLAQDVLIVAAQVVLDYLGENVVSFGDGVITKRNTFQKYFEQKELKDYIDTVLGVESVPAGLGVYFVFRDAARTELFRSSRFHSRRSTPRVRVKVKRFEDYEQLLAPLISFITERGRLPVKGELAEENEIIGEFRTLNRAFKLISQATSDSDWEQLATRRREDLLVYIALSNFSKRPKFGLLPDELKYDVKSFFGSYKKACEEADQMLFSLGQEGVVKKECRTSNIGKLVPDGLYVHVTAIESLPPLLRLYEGCASRTVGRMDGATLVKFHTDKPKISYLYYPTFDEESHPPLHSSVRIDLRDLHVKYSDYSTYANPPILHRKETFVASDYVNFEKFRNLTVEEESAGLLESPVSIGTREGWERRLLERSVKIVDHQVLRLEEEERVGEDS